MLGHSSFAKRWCAIVKAPFPCDRQKVIKVMHEAPPTFSFFGLIDTKEQRADKLSFRGSTCH
jgi:hypothetical protein